jgi:hypothetical protein
MLSVCRVNLVLIHRFHLVCIRAHHLGISVVLKGRMCVLYEAIITQTSIMIASFVLEALNWGCEVYFRFKEFLVGHLVQGRAWLSVWLAI